MIINSILLETAVSDLITGILSLAGLAAIVCFFILFTYIRDLKNTNFQILRILMKHATLNGVISQVKCTKCGHQFKSLETDIAKCPNCKEKNKI